MSRDKEKDESNNSGCAIILAVIAVILYWLIELYKMTINFPIIGLKVFDSTYEIELFSNLHLLISMPFYLTLFFISKMVANIQNDSNNSIVENRYKFLFLFSSIVYANNLLVYYSFIYLSYVLILLSIIIFWVLFKRKTSYLSAVLLLIPILSALIFSFTSINPKEKVCFEYKELPANLKFNYTKDSKVIRINKGDTVAIVTDKLGDTTDVYVDGSKYKLTK